jgi:hypothetical protein
MMTSAFIKLNKLDLEEYKIRAYVSGFLIIFILLLDLHRFGAWFLGYRTYIKSYWVLVMLVVSYPLVKYALAGLIQYMTDNKMFKALHFAMFFIAALPFSFCNPLTWTIFAWGGRPWYEVNYFSTGIDLYMGLAWIIPSTLAYMAIAYTVDRFKLFG